MILNLLTVALALAVNPSELVKIQKAKVKTDKGTFTVSIPLQVKKGYHIQAHIPGNPRFIPTNVTLDANSDVQIEKTDYAEGTPFKIQTSPDPVRVYEGKTEITISGKFVGAAKKTSLKGKLRFQACDDKNCFFPVNADLTIAIP